MTPAADSVPTLPLTVSPVAGVAIVCTQALRVLPGRRWVLAGAPVQADGDAKADAAGGATVVVKLFLAADRAAHRHFRRELEGARALVSAGVPAPALLAAGACRQPPGWYLLTGRLDGTVLADALTGTLAGAGVLEAWAGTLAVMHDAGLDQGDAHLANFWWDGARVAVLDPGGVRRGLALRWAWGARRALARALAELPLAYAQAVPGLAARYAQARGWAPAMPRDRALDRALGRARRQRARRFARKSLRSCREFAVEHDVRRLVVVDRTADGPALRALLADPDGAFAAHARWLKAGRSAQVVRLTLSGRDVVVKRYLARDTGRALRRALRPSRAVRAWTSAQRLRLFGVPVARPLAMLERRWGPLRGRAYLVCDYVAGVAFTDHSDLSAGLSAGAAALRELLAGYAALGMSHGDLKASNVLIAADGRALALDLDAARGHRCGVGLRRALARDRARLLANLDHDPGRRGALARALEDIA